MPGRQAGQETPPSVAVQINTGQINTGINTGQINTGQINTGSAISALKPAFHCVRTIATGSLSSPEL
jgi:hypothetical protein